MGRWLILALVAIGIAWRVSVYVASPRRDVARIRSRYENRGQPVAQVRRLDTASRGRGFPIRTYEVGLADGSGSQRRIVGVDALPFIEPKLWRYDDAGRLTPLF